MSMRSDLFSELMGISVIIISFICAWALLGYHRFHLSTVDLEEEQMIYEIKPGDSINSIADDFVKRGWLPHAYYLKAHARLNEHGSIKVGEYRISNNSTVLDLIKQFIEGKVVLYQLTIIEGWTFSQVRIALSDNPVLIQTLNDLSDEEIMEKIGSKGLHPEGQFLPDTYSFSRQTTDLQYLQQAHQALQNTLATAWENRDEKLPIKTPYEALTLASIVEKETGAAHERPLIAGVFMTRLRKNMKLQTDPTVIYGMGSRYQGNIQRKHLREDTPYNTYVHKGLTPTPISMPGAAAIEAVMHPKEEGYLYFVAKADGSGEHYFSKTLKEHNQAVRKYQLKK
jgi:UPF0755 protein